MGAWIAQVNTTSYLGGMLVGYFLQIGMVNVKDGDLNMVEYTRTTSTGKNSKFLVRVNSSAATQNLPNLRIDASWKGSAKVKRNVK